MDGHTYPINAPYDVHAPEYTITNLSKTKDNKNLPKPYKIRRYYTDNDVKVHNTSNDCWVVLFNKVYDLTILIQENFHCLIYFCMFKLYSCRL